MCDFAVLALRSPRIKVSVGWVLLEVLGKNLFAAFSTLKGLPALLGSWPFLLHGQRQQPGAFQSLPDSDPPASLL